MGHRLRPEFVNLGVEGGGVAELASIYIDAEGLPEVSQPLRRPCGHVGEDAFLLHALQVGEGLQTLLRGVGLLTEAVNLFRRVFEEGLGTGFLPSDRGASNVDFRRLVERLDFPAEHRVLVQFPIRAAERLSILLSAHVLQRVPFSGIEYLTVNDKRIILPFPLREITGILLDRLQTRARGQFVRGHLPGVVVLQLLLRHLRQLRIGHRTDQGIFVFPRVRAASRRKDSLAYHFIEIFRPEVELLAWC